jgi:hypothetical protein
MGPLSRYLCDEHRRIEADLRASIADPDAFDAAPYERARVALLRHIGIEEKVLLPDARRRRGGEPLAVAARLRKEHGAIASLLVPTPDHALVGELLSLLASHDPLEEGPGALYDEVETLAGAEVESLLEAARAQPAPPVARHFDGRGTHRTAASALRAHGL